jgi:hypothetical protein
VCHFCPLIRRRIPNQDPDADPLTCLNPDTIRIRIRNTDAFTHFFLSWQYTPKCYKQRSTLNKVLVHSSVCVQNHINQELGSRKSLPRTYPVHFRNFLYWSTGLGTLLIFSVSIDYQNYFPRWLRLKEKMWNQVLIP